MNVEDYKKYIMGLSINELLDIERNIDKNRNPEKFEILKNRIKELFPGIEKTRDSMGAGMDPGYPKEKANPKTNWIAGFWPRIVALLIDSIVLGVIGFLLLLLFGNILVLLGSKARLVGLVISLIYLTLLNSRIGNGQTVGKRIMKLRVVDTDNSFLSVKRSFCRHLILTLPVFLNGVYFYVDLPVFPFGVILYLIVFGGFFSIPYLYVFNRRTRQSLHDLVVGSYVVNSSSERQDVGEVAKFHYWVVAIIFFVACFLPLYFQNFSKGNMAHQPENYLEMNELENIENILSYNFLSGSMTFFRSGETKTTTTYFRISAFLKKDMVHDEEIAKEISQIIIKKLPDKNKFDEIQVVLIYGMDIGIASKWNRHLFTFNPHENGNQEN